MTNIKLLLADLVHLPLLSLGEFNIVSFSWNNQVLCLTIEATSVTHLCLTEITYYI